MDPGHGGAADGPPGLHGSRALGGLLSGDARSGGLLREILAHKAPISALGFSPDGATVVSSSQDATLKLWQTQTLSPIRSLVSHQKTVTTFSFTSDGKVLVSGGEDDTLKWWSVY